MTISTRGLRPLARRLAPLALLACGLSPLASSPLASQPRTPPPVADSGVIGFDDDGLRIHSPDGKKQLKIRGYVTADLRHVLNDTADGSTNGLALRRARVFLDANVNPWMAFRLLFDIGPASGTSPMQDAYVDVSLPGTWWLRAGKQKTPVGLERYMSISAQLLPERSIAANLHASRDLGLLLTGGFANEHVELSLGMFNGAPDGSGTQDSDPNDSKDLTYRLWFKPVKKKVGKIEQGFGFAYNGSTGIERSPAAAGARLPTFRTPAQISWFSYAEPQGVRASGRHTRNGVFTYFHQGPFGAFAEWFSNSQVVSRGPSAATIGTTAWVANAQVSLSGELSAQEGIAPKALFDPSKGDWGAFQVGVRAAQVRVGDDAFPVFASPTTAARSGLELGGGINWYITRQTKMQLAYEHTSFEGGAAAGDRKAERYVQVRWQAYF
jgi:phosphate-selective porin OprO/OprP